MALSMRSTADADSPFETAQGWRGRRVTLMGLGRHGGGVAAARYLAEHGAQVVISDVANRASLAESLNQLEGLPIAGVHLGGHDVCDFLHAEYIVVNPAVSPDHPCLKLARQAGASITSETELFLAACPARVIGVSGSNGKTTTASMLAAILAAAGRRTWLGGNIGRSLLADVDHMSPEDLVVLELSSFQLAHLGPQARLPQRAIVTNCTPNHLDWHGTFAAYADAKRRLFHAAASGAFVIANTHDPIVSSWRTAAGPLLSRPWPLGDVPPLSVLGDHNRQNAACAAAAAESLGIGRPTIVGALSDFQGLPHRVQFLGELQGRRFFNDSKSTSPAATVAALDAVPGPVWLLAGGHAKGADFHDVAEKIAARTRGLATFGAARDSLRSAILKRDSSFHVHAVERMSDALDWCWQQSSAGDAILLSPAAASYDQFQDYVARGETFAALVGALAAANRCS
jgi:UDP-N-acetylmuramoylalanine--D-glutamate ligase